MEYRMNPRGQVGWGGKRAKREEVDRRRHRGVEVTSQPLERVRTCEIYWGRLRGPAGHLQISYIHARRQIKYSFIAAGEEYLPCPRGRGEIFAPSFSIPADTHSCVRGLLAITPARLQTAAIHPFPVSTHPFYVRIHRVFEKKSSRAYGGPFDTKFRRRVSQVQ